MRSPISPALYDQFASGWRGYVLVAALALTTALFGAAQTPVLDLDESRYVQASRQMAESGDYLDIRLQDEPRHRKPIGIYWLQAGAARAAEPLTQTLNAIWPYRLVSALGLVMAALAALWGGQALVSRRAAFFGASLFAAGMLAGFEGMLAKTDAVLAGFTSLAMAALAHLRLQRGAAPKAAALIFWGALACGILVKGPVTPMVAMLAVVTLGIWERDLAWLRPLLWWPGPLLAFSLAGPWYVHIGLATQGAFFRDMIGDIAPKMIEGTEFGPPGYHLFLLPFLIFPAIYALPAAARLAWEALRAPRRAPEQAGMRFLVAWAAPTFLFFELMPMKLPHYVLPAYPAIALMCGAGLAAMSGRPWRTAHPAGLVLFAVSGLMIVALTALFATFMAGDLGSDLRRAVSAALVGLGVVGFSLAGLMMLRRPALRCAILIACALSLSFSLRDRLLPEASEIHVSSGVVAALTRARAMPNEERPLWVVDYGESSLVFLTRSDIRQADAAFAGAQAQAGQIAVVEGRAMETLAAALGERDLMFEALEPPVRGFALGRGERVALFVGRIVPVSAASADGPARNP